MVSLTDRVVQHMAQGQPLQLLLDYDGTLSPIVEKPAQAFLPNNVVNLLRQLSQTPMVHLAIVSGRSVAQLCHFLAALQSENIWLGGLHGGEVYHLKTATYLQQLAVLPAEQQQRFNQFKTSLACCLQEHGLLAQGIVLEDKGHSLALHYRLASALVEQQAMAVLNQLLQTVLQPDNAFRLQAGKQVVEILPKGSDKGQCVQFLHQYWAAQTSTASYSASLQPPLLCYIGDDLTDEAAFQAVNTLGGISVMVGKPLTVSCATAALPTVESVHAILEQLVTYSRCQVVTN